jgi:hypothetical protein
MRRHGYRAVCGLLLAGCSFAPPDVPPAPIAFSDQGELDLQALEARALAVLFEAEPALATQAGRGEFDGYLGAFTDADYATLAREADAVLIGLEGLRAASVNAERRLDRDQLVYALRRFCAEVDRGRWRVDPALAPERIERALHSLYTSARGSRRAEQMVARLHRVPQALETAKQAAQEPAPELVQRVPAAVERALAAVSGQREWFASQSGVSDSLRNEHQQATASADAALVDYRRWALQHGTAGRTSFRVGVTALDRYMRQVEGLDSSTASLILLADNDVNLLRRAVGELALQLAPDQPIAQLMTQLRTAATMSSTEAGAEIRSFMTTSALFGAASNHAWADAAHRSGNEIVTLVASAVPTANWSLSPNHVAWASGIEFADDTGTPSLGVLATAQLTEPGYGLMMDRLASMPAGPRRFLLSRTTADGWAEYAVDAMMQAGYGIAGGGDSAVAQAPGARGDRRRAELELLHLHRQLRTALRASVALALHARELAPRLAHQQLRDHGFLTDREAASELNALLGDPLAFTAYCGKKELVRLRVDAEQRAAGSFDRRRFHEQLLGLGALPIPVLRRTLLVLE